MKFVREDVPPEIVVHAESASFEDINIGSLTEHCKYVKITVQDNGIGFQNSDTGKIFGTFIRLHSKYNLKEQVWVFRCAKKLLSDNGAQFRQRATKAKVPSLQLYYPLPNKRF